MTDMYSLLEQARSPDNNVRNTAEGLLQTLEKSSAGDYFLALSQELRNEQRRDDVRQLAGLRMKVSLDAQDYALKAERQARWLSIPPELRRTIKDNVTATIGASGILARRAAAQVIAKVGFIEITPDVNGWPDLLPGLVGTAMRGDLAAEPRSTALTALGFLLEELDAYDSSPLEQPDVDSALTAICSAMQLAAPLVMQHAAGTAMLNTLPFVASNFEQPERATERDAIMMAICTATTAEDLIVKRCAFSCLEKCAELYYAYLGSYMKVLADLTAVAARHADEHVAVSALGFWTEIAETEASLGPNDPGKSDNHGFTAAALGPLIEMLTGIMATKVEEDAGEDKEAFGVAEAAQTCLQSVAGAARDEVVDPVMRFINTNFMSPDWKRRDAAIMAFGLIMQGPQPDTLRQRYIRDVLPHLGARLKGGSACDPSVSVRSSVAFALAEIFEHHVEVLDFKTELLPAVAMLCTALEDEPVVTEQVTRALDNLLESGQEQDGYTDSNGNSSVLSPAFYVTINLLMTRADKPDASESNVRQSCYEVISTIVHGGSKADRSVLQALLGDSLTRIASSLGRLASATSTQAHTAEAAIQSALVGLVGDIVLAIAEDALPQADAIVASMITVLDARTSTEDAWGTLVGLASFMGGADDAAGGKGGAPAIARYLPALWPRMMAALNSPADASNCKAAVVFASEVARSLGVSLLDRAAEVLTALIKLLTDPLVERAVKPSALVCLGDVALALGPAVQPFLPTMHAVVLGAAAIPVPQDADEELAEYVNDIRTVCLDAWTGMVTAFSSDEKDGASEKARKQQAAAAALCALPNPSGGAPSNFPKDVLSTLAAWGMEWMASGRAGVELDQLRKFVGLLGDLATAVGTSTMQTLGVTTRLPWIAYVLDACQEEEITAAEEDGEDLAPAATMAAYARKSLPK